jgi:hypothetical protein
MRYRLRTLLIVLALGPPAIAVVWFGVFWLNGRVARLILLGIRPRLWASG